MRDWCLKILNSFGYDSLGAFAESMAPSLKYHLTVPVALLSAISALISRVFGLDAWAFVLLIIVAMIEVRSGMKASKIRGEPFESQKLSRFSFKLCCYFVILAAPHVFSMNYENMGNDEAAFVFRWMHVCIALWIVYEYIVSVLENLSTIDGKPKDHLINKLSDKIKIFK